MLVKTVKKILSKDERLINDNEFNITKLYNLLEKYDSKILKELYQNEDIKNKFFKNIDGINIFKQEEFKFFLQHQKPFENGWTKLKNTIGLCDGKYLLRDTQDVVLNFPFKDCILEGGQSNDEVIESYFNYETTSFKEEDKAIEAKLVGKKIEVEVSTRGKKTYSVSGFKEYNGKKRKEVFFNEILAKDEIDRLLEKKALVNWKRYTKDEIGEVKEINRDKNGAIKENFIIKGNNLLALHSLKKEFLGKIKLIYIDPPYNTGSDSFSYNDNFNHSTWLTFMKNRVEIARKLLSEDGIMWIQIDDKEVNYLGVLLDEIFGRENFINLVTVKTKIGGVSGSSEGKSLRDATEFILIYAKDKSKINLEPVYAMTPVWNYIQEEYIDSGKSWKYTSVLTELGERILIKDDITTGRKYYHYPNAKTISVKQYANEHKISEEEVYNSIPEKIFQTTNAQSSIRTTVIQKTENINTGIVSIEYVPTKGKNKGILTEVLYTSTKRMFMFLSDMLVKDQHGNLLYKEKLTTLWDSIQYNNLSKEGKVNFPNGKKPEKLLQNIIEMSTYKGDYVLDFFGGSGSTAAVAHKLERKWITFEQIDSQINIMIDRLQNVVEGKDDKGISVGINWQGGGEFIYLELAKFNEKAKNKILNCETAQELKDLFSELYEKYYLNYNLNIKKFKELIKTSEFKELCLDDMKKMYLSMLDLNSMYINFEDMEDEKFNLSNDDIKLTKQFYGVK
ncbi:MAG: DNA methyltransferase [Fusobacteriaceae bacterium]